jgi:hypothetical protein
MLDTDSVPAQLEIGRLTFLQFFSDEGFHDYGLGSPSSKYCNIEVELIMPREATSGLVTQRAAILRHHMKATSYRLRREAFS